MSVAADRFAVGPALDQPLDFVPKSRWTVPRRIVSQPKGAIGVTLVVVYVLLAVFGPMLAPDDAFRQNFGATLQRPSAAHWFGTDQLGRDVLSRVLVGARATLGIGVGGVALAFLIGVPLGVLAAWRRGWVDAATMRVVDVMLSFPDIVFALAIVAILGANTQNVIVAVGTVCVPVFARTARAVTRSILAEQLMNHWGHGLFRGYSAGSHPKGVVHPIALALLEHMKLPTAGLRSKSWDDFARPDAPRLDFVFTVCDNAAAEVCPVWPGQPMTAHWGVADPAAVEGPETQVWLAFRKAFRELENRIKIFVSLPIRSLDRLRLQERLDAIGRAHVGEAD